MAPKGLSAEEKLKRLEQLFHETKDVFQLKELEKIAPKQKGIVMQSVKDVLQSLVDDNLVTMDKIGTSNYYWSFPSDALQKRNNKIESLQTEISTLTAKNDELQADINSQLDGKEETAARAELLKDLAEAESQSEKLLAELEQYRESDPALLDAKKNATKVALDAANRWTDNIFLLQSYCVNTFNMEKSDFNANFGINDDFDNITL
ncbi:hypothetical protein BZG36_05207 [Bifiguratus adelaidae]|uniref:Meiotic nuclear division protein 1 n=1 Tax=Bifiguratus adelaidae TaxID=1938954 RepID=A0A261XTG3_9FUNG|nr:hypothetical protein BZG36_05207 [Bifiguratus adelaidae]